jgi:transcriptional regulator with XRE-family HTH domain
LALDVIGSGAKHHGVPDAPKVLVGRNIKRLRNAQKLSQEALAHRCGIHPVELARAERGERDMRISTVAKIARGLRVPAKDLLDGIGG